jgi:hypothetical protein
MAPTRRQVLIGAGAASGALALGVGGAPLARSATMTATLRRMAAGLAEFAHARDIGVEYVRRVPDVARANVVASLLAKLNERFALFGTAEDERRRVADEVRRDFEQGRTLNFGGWVLSETGVRLCALWVASAESDAGVHGAFAPVELPDVDRFSWLTPDASFLVSPTDGPLRVRLRSGAPFPQTVTVQLGQDPARRLTVSGPEWNTAQLEVDTLTDAQTRLRVVTSPPWVPANDFRTIGVGIALASWNSWS